MREEDMRPTETLSTTAPSIAHMPTPWRGCKEGDCSCGQIWSLPADCPVLTINSGPTGDKYPALRTVDASEGMLGTGIRVEAYQEIIEYWCIDPEVAKANVKFIVKAVNSHDDLVLALKALAQAVAEEADASNSISGNMGARLTDARSALAKSDAAPVDK